MANESKVSIPKIHAAMFKFQSLITVVGFDKKNPFFNSQYASLPHILQTITPHLQACGLCLTQPIKGKMVNTTLVCVEDGSEWVSEMEIPVSEKAKAQDMGSAITYIRRYAICAMLSITGDEDDDGNAATKAEESRVAAMAKKIEELEKTLEASRETVKNMTIAKLWKEFTEDPIADNQLRIEEKLQKVYPDKVAGFTTKAEAYVAELFAKEKESA